MSPFLGKKLGISSNGGSNTTNIQKDEEYLSFNPTLLPVKHWKVRHVSFFLSQLNENYNQICQHIKCSDQQFSISDSTISILMEEEWDGNSFISFSMTDLENIGIPNDESEIIFNAIQNLMQVQKEMNELDDCIDMSGQVLTSQTTISSVTSGSNASKRATMHVASSQSLSSDPSSCDNDDVAVIVNTGGISPCSDVPMSNSKSTAHLSLHRKTNSDQTFLSEEFRAKLERRLTTLQQQEQSKSMTSDTSSQPANTTVEPVEGNSSGNTSPPSLNSQQEQQQDSSAASNTSPVIYRKESILKKFSYDSPPNLTSGSSGRFANKQAVVITRRETITTDASSLPSNTSSTSPNSSSSSSTTTTPTSGQNLTQFSENSSTTSSVSHSVSGGGSTARPPKPMGYSARKSMFTTSPQPPEDSKETTSVMEKSNSNPPPVPQPYKPSSAQQPQVDRPQDRQHSPLSITSSHVTFSYTSKNATTARSTSADYDSPDSNLRPSVDSSSSTNSGFPNVLVSASENSTNVAATTLSHSSSDEKVNKLKKKMDASKNRRPTCTLDHDLESYIKSIDEKQIPQTNYPHFLNNDLILIEQLGKYKSRYKNIYLLLTDPTSYDTIVERKKDSKKKKMFETSSTSNDVSNFREGSISSPGTEPMNANFDKIFPSEASEQTHATTSSIVIDYASVQLSEHLPLLIDLKHLNELEKVCVSNAFKKIAPIDRRIFSHREKIFIAQNLALADCYNYLFFDNPTSEKSGSIFFDLAGSGSESDHSHGESSPQEKRSGLSKLFSRSSKKEEPYLQVQLVIFEFGDSLIMEMNDSQRYKFFRTGLMIGNWFLEWRENSLVIPSRKPPQGLVRFNPHFHFIPLSKIEGTKNISSILHRLSEVCALWNGAHIYHPHTCNHQHFVNDVILSLDLLPIEESDKSKPGKISFPCGLSVKRLLDRIEKYGFSDMSLYMNDSVKEALFGKKKQQEQHQQTVERVIYGEAYSRLGEEKTLVGNIEYAPERIRSKYTYKNLQKNTSKEEENDEKNFLIFTSHSHLDQVFFDLDTKIGSGCEGKDYFKTSLDGKWDLWLLKLYDRCFWIRMANKIYNPKDAPLSNLPQNSPFNVTHTGHFGPCMCPFNMSGVSLTEFDIQLMMVNPLPPTEYLGSYDPPIPDRIWLPYQK
ncbi:hypothetical protein C9374_012727 [Naegleria lovaniensis]|uniref:Uncharacterized protein n=1 Tax=Naegleria lovaniensis TaxID=51637 RepID=A0AA88H097_NAELO|nr:uncharacterized protein C9374_012727 [Naegleria lovaniensis]KAG2392475.1 hypothetical protein C9374_012727 [Naegleria lovaniensis]